MNKWLKGNGYWCPDCQGTGRGEPLDRFEYQSGGYMQFYARCQTCSGEKRLAVTAKQATAGEVPETDEPARHTILSQLIESG